MLTIYELIDVKEGRKQLELNGNIYECVGRKLNGRLILQNVSSDYDVLYTSGDILANIKDAVAINKRR